MFDFTQFKSVWSVDCEYEAKPGEKPIVHCMVAKELRTGRTFRLWADELAKMRTAPFDVGPNTLVVGYYVVAEMSCFLSLGWPLPIRVMDLYAEFVCTTNGEELPHGRGLIGALLRYDLDTIGVDVKTEMRDLAIRGGPYTLEERIALLTYCEQDVDGAIRLLKRIAPYLDCAGRVCNRGRYAKNTAVVERNGVPIDTETLAAIREYWEPIKQRLISRINPIYDCYEDSTFKIDRFARWLEREGLLDRWPRLESGELNMQTKMRRQMVQSCPSVAPLHELMTTLSELRLENLEVGSDGRNRCMSSIFGTKTGRNSPSTAKFIYGPAKWIRSLIKPEPGRVLAYLDIESEEHAIAGRFSGCPLMRRSYDEGDPYLGTGKQMGAIPIDAVRETHEAERELYKIVTLATFYGMGYQSLARKIGKSELEARRLLDLHRAIYRTFWQWSDGVQDYAATFGYLTGVLGWTIRYPFRHYKPRQNENEWDGRPNMRTVRNFLIQNAGSEILHLAVSLAVERGIKVCCSVHDALLIEASDQEIKDHVAATKDAMIEASRIVLEGYAIRVDGSDEKKWIRSPNRYTDKRGEAMWRTVCDLLTELQGRGDEQTA